MDLDTGLNRVCLPQIGAKAPDFEATTTFGKIQLSNFTGKWVVLFSHPGDFTPDTKILNRKRTGQISTSSFFLYSRDQSHNNTIHY